MQQLFGVKDYQATFNKHQSKIVKLQDSFEISYEDIVDSDFWNSVDYEVISSTSFYYYSENRWNPDHEDYIGEKRTKREQARLINHYTRLAIQKNLKENNIPVSYDTAFYMAHFMKINEGMLDILNDL